MPVKKVLVCQEIVQDRANAKNVSFFTISLEPEDLWGNIGGGSHDLCQSLMYISRKSYCKPKITQLDLKVTAMVCDN